MIEEEIEKQIIKYDEQHLFKLINDEIYKRQEMILIELTQKAQEMGLYDYHSNNLEIPES